VQNGSRRILLLITDLKVGGTPTVVRELAMRLNRPGTVEVEVACLAPWGPVADQIMDAKIPVIALDAAGPTDVRAIVKLVHLIRHRRFDTVFSFLVHANAAAAVASLFCREVRFLQSIQTTQPEPRWHWNVQRIVQHAAEMIVVPSRSAGIVARDWADVDQDRIAIIPNAIDVDAFTSINTADRWRSPAQIHVGFLGRLDPIKRVSDLVAAMALLERRFVLDIYGEGADRPTIEYAIDRFGLRDRVALHGAVARPQQALAQMHLLALPSAAEGFGLVLIEAMAAGVAVVATDVPGIRDVVKHDQTGLLVEVANPKALAMAITQLATDTHLRDRLIAQAKAQVSAHFTWPPVMDRYRRVLGIEG
jgi:glycosyltransferase involved in cell wall biosynthesis